MNESEMEKIALEGKHLALTKRDSRGYAERIFVALGRLSSKTFTSDDNPFQV